MHSLTRGRVVRKHTNLYAIFAPVLAYQVSYRADAILALLYSIHHSYLISLT